MAISKIQLPSNSVEDIHDARIPAPASADNSKVLGVTDTSGTLGWVAQSAGSSDAVLYTAQSLTDAQKAQARANIGAAEELETEQVQVVDIDSTPTANSNNPVTSGGVKAYVDGKTEPEIFWATYGTTTIAQIDAAIQAGKLVAMMYLGKYYILYNTSSSEIYSFASFVNDHAVWRCYLQVNNEWSSISQTSLQDEMYRVGMWSASPNDSRYPSERLVKDSLDAKQDLIAVESAMPANGMLPNKIYDLGTLSAATTFLLASPTDTNIKNEWQWSFVTESTPPAITWPIVCWKDGTTPTLSANSIYEVKVRRISANYKIACFSKYVIPAAPTGDFTFYIYDVEAGDFVSYVADNNMTWRQWVNSVYNTYGYTIVAGSAWPAARWPQPSS